MANGQLEIVVWNVEHGSAVYAKTPNGLSIVMDAGASDRFSPASWLKEQHSVEQCHLFILSHADSDHITDIENVDRILKPATFTRNQTPPNNLVYPTFPPETNPLKYYYDFDKRYHDELAPDSPYLFRPESNWGGVRIQTFWNDYPDKKFDKLNNYSVVTFLIFGNLAFIFPGDLEAPGWESLMDRDLFRSFVKPNSKNKDEVRILVAAHHGRKAGVYPPFLDLCQPHLSIISDKYGVEHTDYDSYNAASSGYPVYDSEKKKTETRSVLTTKTNDYVLVRTTTTTINVVV